MTTNKKLVDMTLDELLSQKKKLKAAAIGLGIVMLFASGILIFLAISHKNYALITVSIATLIGFLPMCMSLTQLNAAIKSRKLK